MHQLAVNLLYLLHVGSTMLQQICGQHLTKHSHECCRHIVLAVRHPGTGQWGALGLSRRAELMDKPLTHASLADLLADYIASYQKWWHTVLRMRVGLPVPHDVMYDGQVMRPC